MPDLYQGHRMLDEADPMELKGYTARICKHVESERIRKNFNPNWQKESKVSNSAVELHIIVCQILKNTTKPVNKYALSMARSLSLIDECRCYNWESASDEVLSVLNKKLISLEKKISKDSCEKCFFGWA